MTQYVQIEKKTNKRGTDYQLVKDTKNNTFSVWRKCENYCRHVKGGIKITWRYVEKDMTRLDAETLFKKRTR
ncbi:hypothetical protein NS303_12720 [Pantoea ananatis]|uniref:hypothetical protein n=1 Tax=Pantoea ananas TaxID=553 RepID=UPI000735ED46|nr:hypothetical protein [Pantoea ananatis]KTR47976.1 hypothetical protein NS303_12720 [Pantoea ananatis]KTR54592.1 hypothetical protein NS311_15660 [Pantoea ananatis]KTR65226.1 hypothetical protein RSA47_10000 [Pantoea ananatis]KTR72525.1 hypothetical protein NS296_02665 [Pantoea ananatis]